MTTTTTNNKTKKAVDQAVKATQYVQKLINDPERIDDWFLRMLVWLGLAIPVYFFFTNADPYISALRGITGAPEGNIIVAAIGFIALCLVQYVEVKPFLLKSTANNKMRSHVNRMALTAYGVDLAVCYHRWPLFGSTAFGFPNLFDIQWQSIGSITAIVFGFAIWFVVKRALGRKF